MRLDDMIMVSIDDHLIEPPDVFERHMPEKYKDDAPKVIHMPDGTDRWVFQGNEAGHFALGAVATWPKEEWNMDPAGYSEMRPGAYDIHDRIDDMNAGGVLASLCFPTFTGFAGTHMSRGDDQKLTAMAFSAYNDWHLDDWCNVYPGRFMPLGILPLRNVDAMVAEIHRIAGRGFHAVSLPEAPHAVGLPSFFNEYWDPVFEALCEEDIVMCLHIGLSVHTIKKPDESPDYAPSIISPLLSALAAADLFSAGVFMRFPSLRVAISEGGIGWIPFFLDKMDRYVVNQQWTGLQADARGRTPTQVFREQFMSCFITDPSALALRDRIGMGIISWESDYPHSDSTWPNGPELLLAESQDAGLSDAEINEISYANASRFLRFDPFEHTPKEEATVGHLRALAADVDISTTSKEEYRIRYEKAHSNA